MNEVEETADFAVLDAYMGVMGEHDRGCCGMYEADSDPDMDVPCTRVTDHGGDHVASHTDGHVLARWPASFGHRWRAEGGRS